MLLPAPQLDRATYWGTEVRLLVGKRLTEPNLLMMPAQLALVGQYLVVADYDADTVGMVLSRVDGKLLGRFGVRQSLARGSLDQPVAIDPDVTKPGAFWVVDEGARTLIRFSIVEQAALRKVVADTVIAFPDSTAASNNLRLSEFWR